MARGWQVLDLSTADVRLRYERGRVAVERDGIQVGVTPLDSLAVILAGPKVSLSAGALSAFTEKDVALVITDWKGEPVGGAYSWSESTRVGARQRAQIGLTLPRAKNAWARIVTAKILGQAHTLKELDRKGWNDVQAVARDVRSGDPNNKEALAARLYWARLFPDTEFSRRPGLPSGRNAMLNYAYTVLRGHCMRSVIAAGLHPALGLLHHGRSNQFALVDDLIEPFRPAIDYAVAMMGPPEADHGDMAGVSGELVPTLSSELRHSLVDAARAGFGSGRRITSEMDKLAQHFARYCEGELDRLVVPSWSGPDNADLDLAYETEL